MFEDDLYHQETLSIRSWIDERQEEKCYFNISLSENQFKFNYLFIKIMKKNS